MNKATKTRAVREVLHDIAGRDLVELACVGIAADGRLQVRGTLPSALLVGLLRNAIAGFEAREARRTIEARCGSEAEQW